jgi:2-oxoglutarate dehydrogenase E2 component (dihydrolipoamide succinyltransferase)
MGESIVEGTLTRWLKKVGDKVERDEPLFEISTDKVDTEIPSPVAGVLTEVLFAEGATVAINTVVARIGDGVAAPAPAPAPVVAAPAPVAAAPAPVVAAPAPVAAPVATAPAVEDLGPLSPLVRKMARENDVDLTTVAGTGAGGRITKQDVEAVITKPAAPVAVPAAVPVPAPAPVVAAPVVAAATPAPEYAPPAPRTEAAKFRIEPMSTMRKKIAEHMAHSMHTAAHVTTVHKVDMTAVAKLREKSKAAFQAQYGFSLTFLPFVAAATCKALREFPILNASIDGTNILYHNDINMGFAVALDNGSGLIVPVVANADEKNVTGLQRSIVDLAARARSRQLKPDEVKGGTFAITNFGSFGSVFATPVINQPNVAILGVGTVEKTPVVINDAIAIRSICYLALTFDHRLIDGALADMFTGRVKQLLENWSDSVL